VRRIRDKVDLSIIWELINIKKENHLVDLFWNRSKLEIIFVEV
jgi:hypothetical protein